MDEKFRGLRIPRSQVEKGGNRDNLRGRGSLGEGTENNRLTPSQQILLRMVSPSYHTEELTGTNLHRENDHECRPHVGPSEHSQM